MNADADDANRRSFARGVRGSFLVHEPRRDVSNAFLMKLVVLFVEVESLSSFINFLLYVVYTINVNHLGHGYRPDRCHVHPKDPHSSVS